MPGQPHLDTGSTDNDLTYLGAGRGEGFGRGRVEGPPATPAGAAVGRWLREGEPLGMSILAEAVGAGLFMGEARGRVAEDDRTAAGVDDTPACCNDKSCVGCCVKTERATAGTVLTVI